MRNLEFGINYKSLEFGPDLKESSKFKVDSTSTNCKFLSLDRLLQCKKRYSTGPLVRNVSARKSGSNY